MNIRHQADWRFIKDRKDRMIQYNNQRENAHRIPHKYREGELVLIKTDQRLKYGSYSYLGPYPIVQVNNNGTVKVREENVTDVYNIRNIVPYKQ